MNNGCFITGSNAYGTPTPESDIDLVVLVRPGDMSKLMEYDTDSVAETRKYWGSHGGRASLRFGNLNLICITDENEYTKWKKANEFLEAKKPVTREEAVALFELVRGD